VGPEAKLVGGSVRIGDGNFGGENAAEEQGAQKYPRQLHEPSLKLLLRAREIWIAKLVRRGALNAADKRRERASHRFRHGPQQLGFFGIHIAITSHGVGARIKNRLLDVRHGLRQTRQGSID
jgi:hypothetical protein